GRSTGCAAHQAVNSPRAIVPSESRANLASPPSALNPRGIYATVMCDEQHLSDVHDRQPTQARLLAEATHNDRKLTVAAAKDARFRHGDAKNQKALLRRPVTRARTTCPG